MCLTSRNLIRDSWARAPTGQMKSDRHTSFRCNQKGPGLLELIIAVFIASLLAMVGLPMYQDYMVRAKITEDLATVQHLRREIQEYFDVFARLPNSNEQLGMPPQKEITGARLKKARIQSTPEPGSIRISFDKNQIPEIKDGRNFVYLPTVVGNPIRWNYGYGKMLNRYRPTNGRK